MVERVAWSDSGFGAATVREFLGAGIRRFVLVDRNADALRDIAAVLD
jgi:NADP-dependent 3-hydroxy acid dehydrogenase YdfG